MQPKFTQRKLGSFCAKMVTLLLLLAVFSRPAFAQELPGNHKKQKKESLNQKKAEIDQARLASITSVGPAPVQPGADKGNVILPDAGNPVSRAWCYNGGGPFQLNRQTSLLSTALTPIGAPVAFGFPGAAAWVTTTNLMYVVDQAAPFALYRVDTLTGVRTFIANCTGVPQANLTGMTWDPSSNTMYGVSTSLAVSQIFTINITTGVCTPIGSPSSVAPGVIMINAAPGGSLFSSDIVNDNLYKWDKTTGVPTLVGPLGYNANFGQDGHFDFSDGQYFMACFNATAFQAQLRIVDTLTGASTLEGVYGGQIETFAIYTPPQPPCTGTPNPGNTISNTVTACPAVPVSLTIQNYTPGSQVTYQWQKSTVAVGGPYSNIAGATGASYNFLQTVAGWYRCIVTCVASGNSGTSAPVFVGQNPFYNCYCINPAGNTADEEILNVTFGTINNSSACGTLAPGPGSIINRYGNYRNVGPPPVANGTQVIGNNLPISVQVGTCGGNFGSAVAVWIDMNQNGNFEHPAERVFLSSTTTGPHFATGLATIPGTALTGLTGMRVMNVETGAPANITPCGGYTWGETEDYLINLIPCVPITGITNASSFSAQCSGSTSLTASAGLASLPQWQWEYRPTSASPWQLCTAGGLGGVIVSANTATLQLANVPNTLNGYQFRPFATNPCSAIDFGSIATLTVTKLVALVSPTSATICNGSIQAISLANSSTSTTATFNATGLPIAIPDANIAGISSTIAASGMPASGYVVTDIKVRISIPAHTWVGDLVMTLTAPNGNRINLDFYLSATGNGPSTGMTNSLIQQSGGASLGTGSSPFTGPFAADLAGPAANFFGAPSGTTGFLPNATAWSALHSQLNGNWTLRIGDAFAGDVGSLTAWSLEITYGSPAAGVWTSTPAAPNTMFTDPAATVAYTGTPVNTIYVKPAATTTYCVVYTTASPSCVSDPTCVTVNVTQPIGGIVQPVDKSVCVGGTTSFTVGSTGGPFAYQWEESRDNGLTWAAISNGGVYSGATTNTLTLTGVTRSAPVDMNNFLYRCNVNTAPCPGSFTTTVRKLTVFALPAVSITATDLALTPGQQSTLTGTSNPAPLTASSWSWTLNGSAVGTSALNPVVNTSSIKADIDKLGNYRATVTDVNGCTNTSNTLLIESEVSDRLWIYPNPNNGIFQVRLYYPGVYTERRRVQIFNQIGQEIMSRDMTLTNTTAHYLRMDVDLSLQPSGIYVVKVIDQYTGKATSGFVVKQ